MNIEKKLKRVHFNCGGAMSNGILKVGDGLDRFFGTGRYKNK